MKPLMALLGVVLVAASGLLHGAWTGRWSRSGDLETAVARLQDVPKNIDGWKLEDKDRTLDERSLQIGGIAGYLLRSYTKVGQSDEHVTILLLCGRPGAIAVHTPDVCYTAAGYTSGPQNDKQIADAGEQDAPANFKACLMSRDNLEGLSRLQIFWSWTATGEWVTPANPRMGFARKPFLYKLYVIRNVSSTPYYGDSSVTREFIRKLLPTLDTALFKKPQAAAAGAH